MLLQHFLDSFFCRCVMTRSSGLASDQSNYKNAQRLKDSIGWIFLFFLYNFDSVLLHANKIRTHIRPRTFEKFSSNTFWFETGTSEYELRRSNEKLLFSLQFFLFPWLWRFYSCFFSPSFKFCSFVKECLMLRAEREKSRSAIRLIVFSLISLITNLLYARRTCNIEWTFEGSRCI